MDVGDDRHNSNSAVVLPRSGRAPHSTGLPPLPTATMANAAAAVVVAMAVVAPTAAVKVCRPRRWWFECYTVGPPFDVKGGALVEE